MQCNNFYDSWFASSKEYDKLKKNKLLSCHICNSLKIKKTLMSPNVAKSKEKSSNSKEIDKLISFKKKILNYQKFIKKNFNYVGKNFAYEARSLHYSKKKNNRNIYGKATDDEIKDLKEEGINTEQIPWINDKEN